MAAVCLVFASPAAVLRISSEMALYDAQTNPDLLT